MLRIHFESEDLTRTTVASSGDVLWEILLSLHTLQERTGDIAFGDWRKTTAPLVFPSLRPLFELAPPRGYSADFLTPTCGQGSLESGLETILLTSSAKLESDFLELARQKQRPLVSRLPEAGAALLLDRIAEDVRRFFEIAIAPYWKQISRDIEADRGRHLRTLGDHGVEQVLETLHPAARWQHPVLRIDGYVDQDLYLAGRGIVLVPSFFCRRHPITLKHAGSQPVLVFPVRQRTWLRREDAGEPAGGRPLAGLLGRTRTTVLETTVGGCSTTHIARTANISLAAVSHHTKVLREASLITTLRDGYSVRHQITELGLMLLNPTTG